MSSKTDQRHGVPNPLELTECGFVWTAGSRTASTRSLQPKPHPRMWLWSVMSSPNWSTAHYLSKTPNRKPHSISTKTVECKSDSGYFYGPWG